MANDRLKYAKLLRTIEDACEDLRPFCVQADKEPLPEGITLMADVLVQPNKDYDWTLDQWFETIEEALTHTTSGDNEFEVSMKDIAEYVEKADVIHNMEPEEEFIDNIYHALKDRVEYVRFTKGGRE